MDPDLGVRGWRAWYADGVVRDSRTATPNDLPRDGLQVVMLYVDGGRRAVYGTDWIWYTPAWGWRGTDRHESIPADALVFPGTALPDEAFEALRTRAYDDVGF